MVLWLAAGQSPAQAAPADAVTGQWRITKAAPAPWVGAAEAKLRTMRRGVGQSITFKPERIRARAPVGCDKVQYELTQLPTRGLFQGALPEPADVIAVKLGLNRSPVPTVRVSCESGVFDYHQVDADTLLLGLDNIIWTLDFQPASARGAVREFLSVHLANDKAFTSNSVALKARWLTPALTQAIERYFAATQPGDEPPVINGDPFTDSQEYPTGFSIQRVAATRKRAQVRVWYADLKRWVDFDLKRTEREGWRIDDVRTEEGPSLRRSLAIEG